MICEYALEPELVATWHQRELFRHFIERFGFRDEDGSATGRVVARYPSNWKKRVWATFDAESEQSAEYFAKRRRVEILLEKLWRIQTPRSDSVWEDQCTWLENAEEENSRRPFHAILALDNPRDNSQVVRGDDLLPGLPPPPPPLWNVPREIPVQRTSASIATHLKPMLRCATRILFVDPYFRAPKPRWQNPLREFLKIICGSSREVTLEFHTSACYKEAPSWDFSGVNANSISLVSFPAVSHLLFDVGITGRTVSDFMTDIFSPTSAEYSSVLVSTKVTQIPQTISPA